MIRFLKICKHYIASVKGWEFRDSFKTGFSLGTNFWDGLKGADGESLNQRTGILNFRSGDFGLSYENDGVPFGFQDKAEILRNGK